MSEHAQINVRLSREQMDVIAAAVFVRDLRSPQVLFEPLVDALVDELLTDAGVRDAVNIRRRNKNRSSNVSPLRSTRTKRRSSASDGPD